MNKLYLRDIWASIYEIYGRYEIYLISYTDTQTHRHTHTETDTHTHRHTHTQTHTHTHTHTPKDKKQGEPMAMTAERKGKQSWCSHNFFKLAVPFW